MRQPALSLRASAWLGRALARRSGLLPLPREATPLACPAAACAPLQGSWFEPLEAAGAGRLAGVVSNPPYISSAEMPGLQAEVGRHEPHLALHGGEGLGIDCLLPICVGAARLLRPGGLLALETAGGEQARYIADLLAHMRCSALGSAAADGITGGAGGAGAGERLAFTDVRVRRDLRGVDRFVTASRAPQPPPDSNVDAA